MRLDSSSEAEDKEKEHGQDIVDSLTLLHTLAPTFDRTLHSRLTTLFPAVLSGLRSRYALLRQCAAQCLATLCDVMTVDAMRVVVQEVVPLLGDTTCVGNRQGAIEVIYGQ